MMIAFLHPTRQSVDRRKDHSRERVQRGEVAQVLLERRDYVIGDGMEVPANVAVLAEPAPHEADGVTRRDRLVAREPDRPSRLRARADGDLDVGEFW
jgi:hypothetical protein